MKNLIQNIYKYRLNILTGITFVFPILPLIVLSVWALFMMFISLISGLQHPSNLSSIIWGLVMVFWLFGGVAGLLGAIFAMFKIHNIKTLVLFVYGALSYSIIAVIYIAAGLGEKTLNGFFIASYLSMTLVVISIQIVKLNENVTSNK